MKIFLLSLHFFLFSSFLFAQSVFENIITSHISGYQLTFLNGYGFENNNLTTISNISSSNPSLITELPSYSFGISKMFNTNIKDRYDIAYNKILNWIPQSAGFLIGFGEFRIGAGMSQTYNSKIEMDPIPVTTTEQPDGTGEFFTFNSKTIILTSSLLGAYPVHNLFSRNDQLSIGVQMNLHFIHHEESILQTGMNYDFRDASGNIGLNYKFSDALPLTQLSLFYEMGFKTRYPFNVRNLAVQRDVDPERDSTFYVVLPIGASVTAYIPDKLSLGILYQTSEEFVATGNISNIFWNSYGNNIHNQVEFSSNIIYKWNRIFTTSAGIYVTDRDYLEEFGSPSENSAVFLSLGAIVNISFFNIELALADSHLFSDEMRKQTLLKLGMNLFM